MRCLRPRANAPPAATPWPCSRWPHERTCEAELAQAIDADLDAGALPDPITLAERFAPAPRALPEIRVALGSLADYDVLLTPPVPGALTTLAGDRS